jgi:hypothetical protein
MTKLKLASESTKNRNTTQSVNHSAFEIVKNGIESIEIGTENVSDPQDDKSLSKKTTNYDSIGFHSYLQHNRFSTLE